MGISCVKCSGGGEKSREIIFPPNPIPNPIPNREVKEVHIKERPESIPVEDLKIISEQSKKCICKINNLEGFDIPGFFCLIPFPDNKCKFPVLIIYSKNFNFERENIILELNLDNDKLAVEIKIDKSRKVYKDKINNIIFIEIKPEDGFDIDSFFEIDIQIFQSNFDDVLKEKSVYILYYEGNEKEAPPTGIILTITENYKIYHNCKIRVNSLGYPIINLISKELIGINFEENQNKNGKNYGIILKESIEKFIEEYKTEANDNNNLILIEQKNYNDEITILYDILFMTKKNKMELNILMNEMMMAKLDDLEEKYDILKIFGEKFVKNNRDKCKIRIGHKEYELTYDLNIIADKDPDLEMNVDGKVVIKLICMDKLNDFSNMFAGCMSLELLPDIDKIDTSKVTNMRGLFAGCINLSHLPDIGIWKTNNVKDMSKLFLGCLSLKEIPEIGKWNTKQVTNMEYLFGACRHLKSLPDISKWKTDNVINMSFLFYECYFVTNISDISKWNTENVTSMQQMFFGCKHLAHLPDISKWNTKNVTTMLFMFGYCEGITSFPDFSKWNTQKVNGPLKVLFMNVRKDKIPQNLRKFTIEGYK